MTEGTGKTPAEESPPNLFIVGARAFAPYLCRLAAWLGFRVVVLEDDAAFATKELFPEASEIRIGNIEEKLSSLPLGEDSYLVIASRDHLWDEPALRIALGQDPAYVGLMGHRRRSAATLRRLRGEGVPEERLARVCAPLGLNLGSKEVADIALSVMAEIVALRRGGREHLLRLRSLWEKGSSKLPGAS